MTILVLVIGSLVASVRWAQASSYLEMIQGDEFFIPGKPVTAYLTVEPRYTVPDGGPDYASLRRAKLRLLGSPLDRFRYYFQGIYKTHNFSPTDDQVFLQEAWVRWQFSSQVHFQLGQFKPPMGLERFTADETLFTILRSQATNHLVPDGNLGDSFTRDYGVQLSGKLEGPRLAYALALMGGNGANNGHFPEEGAYLVCGRLVWQPYQDEKLNRGFHLGAAFSQRRNHDLNLSSQLPGSASLGYEHFDGEDRHYDFFLAIDWGPFSFRGEGLLANYLASDPGLPDLSARGYYVQAACFLGSHWQPVAKYEAFEPLENLPESEEARWTTLGLNCYLIGDQIKLMADYVFKRGGTEGTDDDTFLLQLQFFFSCPHNPALGEPGVVQSLLNKWLP